MAINRDPRVDVRFPTQLVRFIQLRVLSSNPFELAEIEVHGEGFVPRGLYETQLIQFAQPVNYGALTFRARKISLSEEGESNAGTDEQVRVIVQMRNGVDETPLDYYQIADVETQSEVLVSKEEYDEFAVNHQGQHSPGRHALVFLDGAAHRRLQRRVLHSVGSAGAARFFSGAPAL